MVKKIFASFVLYLVSLDFKSTVIFMASYKFMSWLGELLTHDIV